MAQIVGGTTTMKPVGFAENVTENEYWESDEKMERPYPMEFDSKDLG